MLYYNRVDISEGNDLAKSNNNKECMICHYFFFNHGRFKFQDSLCNGCHDLTMLTINISNIAIISVKKRYYRCIIRNIRKFEAINLLKNYVFKDRGYI